MSCEMSWVALPETEAVAAKKLLASRGGEVSHHQISNDKLALLLADHDALFFEGLDVRPWSENGKVYLAKSDGNVGYSSAESWENGKLVWSVISTGNNQGEKILIKGAIPSLAQKLIVEVREKDRKQEELYASDVEYTKEELEKLSYYKSVGYSMADITDEMMKENYYFDLPARIMEQLLGINIQDYIT